MSTETLSPLIQSLTSSTTPFLKILEIYPNSPGCKANLQPYTDFILTLNNTKVESVSSLASKLGAFRETECTLEIFNIIELEIRRVKITPNMKWKRANSLIGCVIREEVIATAMGKVFLMRNNNNNNEHRVLDTYKWGESNPISSKEYIIYTKPIPENKLPTLPEKIASEWKNSKDLRIYSPETKKQRTIPNDYFSGRGGKVMTYPEGLWLVSLTALMQEREREALLGGMGQVYNMHGVCKGEVRSRGVLLERREYYREGRLLGTWGVSKGEEVQGVQEVPQGVPQGVAQGVTTLDMGDMGDNTEFIIDKDINKDEGQATPPPSEDNLLIQNLPMHSTAPITQEDEKELEEPIKGLKNTQGVLPKNLYFSNLSKENFFYTPTTIIYTKK